MAKSAEIEKREQQPPLSGERQGGKMRNGEKVIVSVKSPVALFAIASGAVSEEEISPGRYQGTVIPSPRDPVSQNNPDGHPSRLWISLSKDGEAFGRSIVSLAGERGVDIRKTR